jgi:hypothetical protein
MQIFAMLALLPWNAIAHFRNCQEERTMTAISQKLWKVRKQQFGRIAGKIIKVFIDSKRLFRNGKGAKNYTSQKVMAIVASKKVIEQNVEALKSYDFYKETSDLVDRIDIALGRKPTFKVATGSALNFEINQHVIASTTT